MLKSTVALLTILFSLAACSKGTVTGSANAQPQANTPSQAATGTLNYTVPDGWVSEKTSSTMRVAQYKLPRQSGDQEDASLVLYYFGQNQGGGAQANIDRWISQMHQADGSDPKARAKSETLTVNGLKVTTLDLSGTYSAEMTPGAGELHEQTELSPGLCLKSRT